MLPRLGPSHVVVLIRRERTREGARLALRPQPEIDAERLTLRRHLADGPKELLRPAHGVGLIAVVHEHDVDVGAVVELAAPELPHADDAEPIGIAEGCFQARVGEVGEGRTGRGDVGSRAEIEKRDAQHLATLEAPQSVESLLRLSPLQRGNRLPDHALSHPSTRPAPRDRRSTAAPRARA